MASRFLPIVSYVDDIRRVWGLRRVFFDEHGNGVREEVSEIAEDEVMRIEAFRQMCRDAFTISSDKRPANLTIPSAHTAPPTREQQSPPSPPSPPPPRQAPAASRAEPKTPSPHPAPRVPPPLVRRKPRRGPLFDDMQGKGGRAVVVRASSEKMNRRLFDQAEAAKRAQQW